MLFPFAPAATIDAELACAGRGALRDIRPRSAPSSTRVGRFDAHVWLAPEPHERFIALLAGTYDRFPEFPPYGDAFAEPVPHLTIAEIGRTGAIEQVTERSREEIGPRLPFAFTVDRVGLFEVRHRRHWQQSDRFELG